LGSSKYRVIISILEKRGSRCNWLNNTLKQRINSSVLCDFIRIYGFNRESSNGRFYQNKV
jgi:hypothetical protein